ncbi:MAG: hypothetical protein E6Q58_05395 [Niabella sp.]|nr:MAG: hypothetical protein E6Q58_05395 [Niabella sp.]
MNNNQSGGDESLPNFSRVQMDPNPESNIAPAPQQPAAPMMNTAPIYSNRSSSGAKVGLLLGLLFFFLLLIAGGTLASAALIANGVIKVSNTKVRTFANAVVGAIPFMPKTPEYVLTKSGEVMDAVSSAYIKASIVINSDELKKTMPIYPNGLEIALEGPVDSTDKENPKMMINTKVTKDFDADFGLIDQNFYFRVNKIPAIIYPMLGFNAENFSNNPFIGKWIYYDVSSMDSDASNALKNHNADKQDQDEKDKIIQQKLEALASDKILPHIKMSKDTLDGTQMYKLSMKLNEDESQEIYKEIMKILMDETQYSTLTVDDLNQVAFKNLELNIWINSDNYYFEKSDFVVDAEIADVNSQTSRNVLGAFTAGEAEVLGVKTVASDPKSIKFTVAASTSMDRHGEKFESELAKPKDAMDFETFMLQMTSFMQGAYQKTMDDGFAPTPNKYNGLGEDAEGFR